jgi:hypothetical protein
MSSSRIAVELWSELPRPVGHAVRRGPTTRALVKYWVAYWASAAVITSSSAALLARQTHRLRHRSIVGRERPRHQTECTVTVPRVCPEFGSGAHRHLRDGLNTGRVTGGVWLDDERWSIEDADVGRDRVDAVPAALDDPRALANQARIGREDLDAIPHHGADRSRVHIHGASVPGRLAPLGSCP